MQDALSKFHDLFVQSARELFWAPHLLTAMDRRTGLLIRMNRSPAAVAGLTKAASQSASSAALAEARGDKFPHGAVINDALASDFKNWWHASFTNTPPDTLADGDTYLSEAQICEAFDLSDDDSTLDWEKAEFVEGTPTSARG